MAIFLSIFGTIILVIGLITSIIAARFNEFDTTPFSKYTFSKLCSDFEGFCNTLVIIGVLMVSMSMII